MPMTNLTAAQTATIDRLAITEGPVYFPSLGVRSCGLADVTFRCGSGFVVTPDGHERPA